MKDSTIEAKHRRMLELLAQGATSRIIAQQMGYQEGTMRVYLHNLYRRIGVANKTEAVVWYLNRERAREDVHAAPPPQRPRTGDLLGDMAVEEDLFAALGVMSHFVGPYGRVWEVGQRLAGAEMDTRTLERSSRSRLLWRALLKGDWAFGKRVHDSDASGALVLDAPSDGVVLAALLMMGGFSLAADRLVAQLTDKRKSSQGASAREATLLRALRDALYGNDTHALATLHKVATEKATTAVLKQVAMALLFHAYRERGDMARARQSANAIWSEADGARKHLQAMGERAFGMETALPAPARAPAKEKAAAGR